MSLREFLFGKRKKRTDDPLGLLSNDPIGAAINNLVSEVKSGRKLQSILSPFIRTSFLKIDILKRLKISTFSGLEFSDELREYTKGLDLERPIGETNAQFDAVRLKFPSELLKQLESDARQDDLRSEKPQYADLGNVFD
jgi:hypothetical protein